MAVAGEAVLVGHQSLEPDRAPCVDLAGRNADLRPEAVAEPVREPGRNVHVNSGGIHHLREIRGGLFIFRHDGVRVVGTEIIDVAHGFRDTVHKLHRGDEVQILSGEILLAHDLARRDLRDLGCAPHFDPGRLKGRRKLRQELSGDRPVNEDRLDRVAGRRVLGLRVDDDPDCLILIRILIDKDVADPVRVAHHRYLGVVHDVADKRVGAPRDEEVDLLVAG